MSPSLLQFGDTFTLSLCGKYMTFLFDPAILDTFFKAPDSDITFRPAVEQFTQRVFGLPSREFFPKHSAVLRDLRHLLVPAELGGHAAGLAEKVSAFLTEDRVLGPQGAGGREKDRVIELYALVRSTIFRSAVAVLFGDGLAE